MNRKGESKALGYVLLVIAILGAYQLGFFSIFGIAPAPTVIPTQPTVPGVTGCSDTSVTMDTDMVEWGAPGTAVTGTTRYWRDGVSTTLTTGDTATVSPGETITMLVESRNDAATNYYGKAMQFVVPCGSFQAASAGSAFSVVGYSNKASNKASEMIRNVTSLTLTAQDSATSGIIDFQCDGAGTANNLTVGQGGTGTAIIKIKGESYRGISPTGNLIMVVESNKSAWDFSKFVVKDSETGAESERVSTPTAFVTGLTAGVGQAQAFSVLGCPRAGQTVCDIELKLLVQAQATLNPAQSNGNGGLNITFYTEDLDRNTILSGTDGIIFGVQDNVGAVSGPTLAGATPNNLNICVG